MSKAVGIEIRAAARRATSWGSAIACGALDGVVLKPHTIKRKREIVTDDSLGRPFAMDSDQGGVKCEGALPAYLRYDGLDTLIALATGATGGVPSSLGSGAYSQKFTLADNLDRLFCTLAVNNNINIDEYRSVKLTGFTLKGETGKPVEIAFDAVADERVVDSAVNTVATFGNVTFFETGNRVLMSQGAFRINNSSASALGTSDAVHPSAFELSYKRKLSGAYTAGSGDTIDEPASDGMPEITLKLTFPRYTGSTNFTDWAAGTAKKMDITFTGGEIGGGIKREFKLSLPRIVPSEVDLPMELGVLTHPVTFACLAASSAPAGMTGITMPFQVNVVNRRQTDSL